MTEEETAEIVGVKADWQNHHIEGYVHQAGNAYFEAPLISHIVDNLWTGGCIHGVALPDDFVKVVSLYPWEQWKIGAGTERVEIKMYDSSDGAFVEDIVKASNEVLRGLQHGKTLVHCQAGLNRSSLVAAFTLMRLGYTAERAIAILREKRSPMVLCNRTFVQQLENLEPVLKDLTADEQV